MMKNIFKAVLLASLFLLSSSFISAYKITEWADGTTESNFYLNKSSNFTQYAYLGNKAWNINISFLINAPEAKPHNLSNDFESLSLQGWEFNSSLVTITHNSSPSLLSGGRSIQIQELDTIGLANYTFNNSLTKGFFEFDFNIPTGAVVNGRGWYLTENNSDHGNNGFWMTLTLDDPVKLEAMDGVNYNLISMLERNKKYKLRVVFDIEADNADFYLDNVYKTSISCRVACPAIINEMRFRGSATVPFYVDDFIFGSNFSTDGASNISVYYEDVLAYKLDYLGLDYVNVSFKANTTNNMNKEIMITISNENDTLLNIKELLFEFNTNNSIIIHTELNDIVYNDPSTPMRINRIYDNVTWDTKTTTNGYLFFSELPVIGIVTLQIFDTTNKFPLRNFYYYNSPFTDLQQTVYVINRTDTGSVLFTLYRETGEVLPYYYVQVYKYLKNTNKYIPIEMHKTDFNGQALLNVLVFNETYRFAVYNPQLTIIHTSQPAILKSTSITLTISLTEDIWFSLDNILSVEWGQPTYNNETKQIIAYYFDTKNILHFVDYTVTRRTNYGDIIICSNRSYLSSATLRCTINPDLSGLYYSELWAETKGNYSYMYVGGNTYQQSNTPSKTGKTGLFVTILIVVALVGMGLWNPAMTVILSFTALILSILLKVSYMSLGSLIALIIVGGIAIFKMKT
jgi:hypothetical protein